MIRWKLKFGARSFCPNPEMSSRRPRKDWSTGRELNPRILVLQTSALATSPPVLIVPPEAEPLMLLPRGVFNIILYKNENPTALR